MHLQIKNLGQIKAADIHVNDLTIICGPNGSNKTWLSYAIYHYFAFPKISHGGVNLSIMDFEPENNNGQMWFDIGSDEFFNYILQGLEIYEDISPLEVHKTFNVNESIFERFSIEQITANKNNNLSLTYLNAQKLQQGMIDSQFDLRTTDLTITSERDSSELKFSYKGSVPSVDKYNRALTAAFQFLLSKLPLLHRPFAITSERVGCLAFQKDIDGTVLRIKDELDSLMESLLDDTNPQIRDVVTQLQSLTYGNRGKLAKPVRENLRAVREVEQAFKKQSFLQQNNPEINEALRQITQGAFAAENGVLHYQFGDNQQLPITVASSSIKSLFHLDLYINNLAKEGDILLIDEPELNLHPDNQRQMAKVIARLCNAGIKVLITTHSDYLIREINNSIMLSHDIDDKEQIMQRGEFKDCDILNAEHVSAYAIDTKGCCTEMDVGHTGIDTQIFDSIINESNQLQNEIYYKLNDE